MISRTQVTAFQRAVPLCRPTIAAQVRLLHASGALSQASNDEELLKQIRDKLKSAMQNKDKLASTVYRSVLSEHQYATKADQMANKAPKSGQLVSLLQKALARRQDSAKQFRDAKPPREDLASKEDSESELIRSFLPEQISVEELETVVKKAIEEVRGLGVEGKKMMGEVMKRVNTQVDRARAPGAMISESVKRLIE